MRSGGRGAQFIKRPNTPFYMAADHCTVDGEKVTPMESGVPEPLDSLC